MQLWPVLLWPKLKARRQHAQHYGNGNINFKFATRTFSTPANATTITIRFFHTFVINALLLITTTWGLTATQQPLGNYQGVNTVADADVVSAVTGLSNGYATPDYIRNYYQISETENTKQQQQLQQQQQQQQQQHQLHKANTIAASLKLGHQGEIDAGGSAGRGFVGLQTNNYGNPLVGIRGSDVDPHEESFNIYNRGFVPTSFTAAGQHYAATLAGLQTATDKSNALHQYATTAVNKNNLHTNHQPYTNPNINNNMNNNKKNNNNDMIAGVDNNKSQFSLFSRLTNYGGSNNGNDGGADITSDTHLDISENEGGRETVNGRGIGNIMQNYALAYGDDAHQTHVLNNFFNQATPFNNAQYFPEQTFSHYFPPPVASTIGYDIQNQQNYNTLNNFQYTTKPPQQHFGQEQYSQQYQQQQPPPYNSQQQQQTYKKREVQTATPVPSTYYQTYIQHINDNKEQPQQNPHVTADNYHRWTQNQMMANYQPKQMIIEKQNQQQQLQQTQPNNLYQQRNLLQEPEMAETSHSARIKKTSKHKSKRHDNQDVYGQYDALLEQNDNTIENESADDLSSVQLQQLERLQEQLQQQQQQFIELQHQLIDHDQQLQIQKHVANIPAPTLPSITQTVHHTPHSLQALSGSPLSKHTHIIKTIPIPQIRQVHVPYRENVTIEVQEPVITPIRKPFAIQIPITKTVTVPKIQEVKIPIEKVKPFPVERPVPYIVERRVPYTVEKQIAQPVYYPVPIKVPILHTVIHKIHKPPGGQHRHQPSYHLPHTVYHKNHGHGHGHGHYY